MKSARSQIDWNFCSPPSSLTTTQSPHLNISSDSALVCKVLLIHGQFRIINYPNLHVCVHAGVATGRTCRLYTETTKPEFEQVTFLP